MLWCIGYSAIRTESNTFLRTPVSGKRGDHYYHCGSLSKPAFYRARPFMQLPAVRSPKANKGPRGSRRKPKDALPEGREEARA
jgi:hypothetical protein